MVSFPALLRSTFSSPIRWRVFSFTVPNQCNDQHGRGNAGPFCNFDPNDNGTQAGLNPALMQLGDIAVKRIVNAIKEFPIWKLGRNAIVVVWDENDYSIASNTNNVLLIVDTTTVATECRAPQPTITSRC
jgi:hypothetical protein